MPKMTSWQAPLVTRRFKTPEGPLADVDNGYANDYSKQRPIMPSQIGGRKHHPTHMNAGGEAAQALLTSLPGVGIEEFPFPK